MFLDGGGGWSKGRRETSAIFLMSSSSPEEDHKATPRGDCSQLPTERGWRTDSHGTCIRVGNGLESHLWITPSCKHNLACRGGNPLLGLGQLLCLLKENPTVFWSLLPRWRDNGRGDRLPCVSCFQGQDLVGVHPTPTKMRSRPANKCRQGERGRLLSLSNWKVEEDAGIYTSKDVATIWADESPWQVLFIHKELWLIFW